jgi:hypothetical protein
MKNYLMNILNSFLENFQNALLLKINSKNLLRSMQNGNKFNIPFLQSLEKFHQEKRPCSIASSNFSSLNIWLPQCLRKSTKGSSNITSECLTDEKILELQHNLLSQKTVHKLTRFLNSWLVSTVKTKKLLNKKFQFAQGFGYIPWKNMQL